LGHNKEVDKDAPVEVDTSTKDIIECNDEHVGKSVSNDLVDDSQQTSALEDSCKKSELTEPQTTTSNEEDQSHSTLSKRQELTTMLQIGLAYSMQLLFGTDKSFIYFS